MSLWVTFIMLFSLTVPVTGVFANGNGGAAADKEGYTMFKIEGSDLKNGTYTDGTLTVNATFTTAENEPKSISWTSNIPVYFVCVKGGPSGVETTYGEGVKEGSALTAPDNKGISHVAFYYKQEAAVPVEDENTEEDTENSGGQTEQPKEDKETVEEPQNDDSNQDDSEDLNQEDSEESNQEENGDANSEDKESEEGTKETGNKSTEIHLHLKNCTAPVGKVEVQLNGEWVEMSNPGNSPLYKLKDEGEFAKEDITAFKLKFESGTERTYDMNEIRVGVEAEGSVNYWLEDCALPEGENPEEPGDGIEEPGDNPEEPGEDEESPDVTEIVKELYIIINKNIETVVKLTLLIDGGESLEFTNVNNLWKLFYTTGLNISDINGIEIQFEDGTTTVIAISKLSFELKDQIIHLEIDDEVLGTDSEEEAEEDEGTGQSDNNDNNSANQGDSNQSWNGGVLPKTGESSKMMFYIAGFLLMAAGTRLRMRKPIKD